MTASTSSPPADLFHGLRNGNANDLMAADQAVHDWYRFVLSFPPHLVREYLQRFEAQPTDCVLDPFCGTGTTIVECKRLGIPSVGVEANPMAFFASSVKTDWSIHPGALLGHAARSPPEYAANCLRAASMIASANRCSAVRLDHVARYGPSLQNRLTYC